MTTQIQRRRGTTVQHSTFTGAEGEITIDTTKDTAVVHDGATAGGHPLAKEDGSTLTNVDINSGTIDGTVIGGTTPAAVTATSLTATGTTTLAGASTTADITFGDNDKAIFGAGSDLQIYHTGAHSYIDDTGTGNLYLNSNGAGTIITGASETQAQFFTNGAVNLFYDNSQKLATTSTGVDVTGTITSDGLTVDTNTLYVDAANNRVGIGTSLPLTKGHFFSGTSMDQLSVDGTGAIETGINFNNSGGTYGQIYFNNVSPYDMSVMQQYTTGSLVFGTNDTERMRITSTGSVGIGTSSPNNKAQVSYTSVAAVPSAGAGGHGFAVGDAGFGIAAGALTSGNGYLQATRWDGSATNYNLILQPNGGSVGIGTSSPALPLDVVANSSANALSLRTRGANDYSFLSFRSNDGTEDLGGPAIYRSAASTSNLLFYTANGGAAAERMRITSSGSVGIGTSSPTQALDVRSQAVVGNGTDGVKLTYSTGNSTGIIDTGFSSTGLEFRTGNSFAAKIDASGNLLVGKTSDSFSTQGQVFAAGGYTDLTRAGTMLNLNRLTSDGDIVKFYKDGTTVGSIGTDGGDAYIGTGDTAIIFSDGNDAIVPFSTTAVNFRGSAIDLGYSTYPFKDLYLSGGVYLGGTGAANKLDDYEEGTWTPVAFGTSTAGTATYVQQKGYYVKIGRAVHYQLYLGWSGHTGTGTLRISGLPFAAGSSANVAYSAPCVAYTNGLTFGSGNLGGYIGSGGTFIAIVMNNSNATPTAVSVDADVTEIIISGMYVTA